MEAGAMQRYNNAIQSYTQNIGNIRSALNEGINVKQNDKLNAIANKQREKLQNIFMSNIVAEDKMREVHEALSAFSVQAGGAVPALQKLNQLGAFNPVKRGLASVGNRIGNKLRDLRANTSVTEAATDEPIELTETDPEGGGANFYDSARQPIDGDSYQAYEPESAQGSTSSDIGVTGQQTAGGTKPTYTAEGESTSADYGEFKPQAGKGLENVGEDAAEDVAEDVGGELTAGAAEAGAGAGEAAAAGVAAATGAGEAAGAGLLATVSAAAGPLAVLAGLGVGIYELFEAFQPKKHPDIKPKQYNQIRTQVNQKPVHTQISVAPSANSALIEAGQSSAS